jgi:transcriptional regulator with XRE-family HTH domain
MQQRITIQPRFGVLVRERRLNLGLSQSDLGDRLGGLSRQHLCGVETGRSSVGLSTLVSMARALVVLPTILLADALGEEWGSWWSPILDSLEDRAPAEAGISDYDLGRAAGYEDALVDVRGALEEYAQAWRPDTPGYADVLPDEEQP